MEDDGQARRSRRRRRLATFGRYVLLVVVAAIVLFPIYSAIMVSQKPLSELGNLGSLVPGTPDLGSFDEAFNDRNLELDYFAGYSHRFRPDLAVEGTLIHYTYPGHRKPYNYDWTELLVSVYVGDRWLLSTGVADNWLSLDDTTIFIEGGYRYPLPQSLTLDITLGYQTLQTPFTDYAYAEVGVSRRLGLLDFRVGYAASSGDARDQFGRWAVSRWLASVSFEI